MWFPDGNQSELMSRPFVLADDLGMRLPAQCRVWSDIVFAVPPGSRHEPGMSQRDEQLLVEALVAQVIVEAFHEAVLHRVSGRDVVLLDPPLLRPL